MCVANGTYSYILPSQFFLTWHSCSLQVIRMTLKKGHHAAHYEAHYEELMQNKKA